ncbi:MAG: class A beta-lactamase, partial [Rhodoferax sp.]
MSFPRNLPKRLGIDRIVFAVLLLGSVFAAQSPAFAFESASLSSAVQKEEQRLGARIGVAVLDTTDGTRWSHRGDERFPLNSTHKAFTCAAFLHKVDTSQLALSQTVSVAATSLLPYSPVIEKSVAPQTVTLEEACSAAVSYSDNTAGNIITDAIGGPAALTSFMRSIGDDKTRLDRKEPELNEATPLDMRDTTTPNAITESLRKIILGNALTVPSRMLLESWMVHDKVA